MTETVAAPRDVALSVVVASVNGRDSLAGCLHRLERSTAPIEVIVVADSSTARSASHVVAGRLGVELVRLDGSRAIPELRGAGIRQARHGIVAILGDYLEVDPGWATSVVEAHRRHPQAAIGGAVENRSADRTVDWAAYLCEYGRFMLPFGERPSATLPGPNVSYDRAVLERECSDLLDRGVWDHVLHQRLASRGVGLWMDPSIVAFYAKRVRAAEFLVQRYRYGRCYAAANAASRTSWRRASRAAVAPAAAAVELWRITTQLAGNRRARRWLLPCWPLLALSAVAWSVGESAGYARGEGHASLGVK